jgi:protein SCO1
MRIKVREYSLVHTRGMWNKAALAAIALALGAGTVAWTRQDQTAANETRRLAVTGIVVTPLEGRQVRVAHDDIPGYMPAMTMAFTLGEGESSALEPGDRVRFTLRVGPDGSVAEAVTVTGRTTTAGPGAVAAAPVARLKRGDALPSLALVDQDGRPFTGDDLRGHATIVTFIFTRCPLPEFCPVVTSRFKELQAALGREPSLPSDTRLLSITLDPEFDTPAVLQAYARAIGADSRRWRFVSGDPAEVLRVARAFSVHVERNGVLLDHTLATALIDPSGRVAEIWRGNGWKASEVLAALRSQKGELDPR